MKTYLVTFDRIGRSHNVQPLVAGAADADQLAEAIYDYAKQHLLSRDVGVSVDLGKGSGFITCGFNNGGTFTVAEQPVYPAPGSTIPGWPGYVVGECQHRVARSEWAAGFRTCERCPKPANAEAPA